MFSTIERGVAGRPTGRRKARRKKVKTYTERLKAAMQHADNISQRELAARVSALVGRPISPQSIQHLTNPKKNVAGSKHSVAIATALGVNANWLATGQGSMLFGMGSNTRSAESRGKRIPVINKIPAGDPRQIVDDYLAGAGMDEMEVDSDVGHFAFGLVIEGESMLPEFRSGDKVVIDPGVKPIPGDFVVAKCNGEDGTFKKYRPRGFNDQGVEIFDLVPLNEDYPIKHATADTCSIVGTMVEHHKYYRRR